MERGNFRLAGILLAAVLAGCSAMLTTGDGELYYQDDFSNPSSGWDRVTDAYGVTDYADGMYRIFSAQPEYYLWATAGKWFPNDVRIEVDATKKAGPDDSVFGILCRHVDTSNYYILMISSDGQAGIAKVVQGNGPSMISDASMAMNEAIQPGLASNHLRADCTGDALALYVNGTLVASASDSSLAGGEAGLWLGSYDRPGADVYFDNFSVRKP